MAGLQPETFFASVTLACTGFLLYSTSNWQVILSAAIARYMFQFFFYAVATNPRWANAMAAHRNTTVSNMLSKGYSMFTCTAVSLAAAVAVSFVGLHILQVFGARSHQAVFKLSILLATVMGSRSVQGSFYEGKSLEIIFMHLIDDFGCALFTLHTLVAAQAWL